jgi:LmbE family N-acetylglucosaminyl deacetylase
MKIRDYFRYAYRAALPLIYARSNFKLFLKTSLTDYDRRVRQLASMTDYFSTFVRPIPIRAPFGDSMLVIAPHQDDETIGCGGALALQVRAGRSAYVVLLHDGADGHDELGMTRPELVALRNEESRRAAAVIGMEPPIFLSHADLEASAQIAAEEIGAIVSARKVDTVFVPFMLDGHPDHRKTNYILAAALKKVDRSVRVFGYEVWGLCIPNVILVIDDVIDQKLAMLRCFEFANKAVDYVQSTQGLNMYHSRMLGSGVCRYAERFFEIPATEYIQLVERVREGE